MEFDTKRTTEKDEALKTGSFILVRQARHKMGAKGLTRSIHLDISDNRDDRLDRSLSHVFWTV